MRRSRTEMPNSVSPNAASPPRLRQRLSSGHILQQLTASIAAHKRSSYYTIADSSSMQNVNPWGTKSSANPWAYKKTESDDEGTISETESTNHYANEKTGSVFDGIQVITASEELLAPLRGFLQLTPETEEEFEDEDEEEPPLAVVGDEDTLKEQFGFCPIPEDLLCDERASFKYNNEGDYQAGYVDDVLVDTADFDDINPSTSKRALEKLFILQTSVWMERPNIELEVPAVKLTTAALRKLERQQIRLSYNAITV